MPTPDFCIVSLSYGEVQPAALHFHQELIQRIASFGAKKYGFRGTTFFQQESDCLCKAFVEFLEKSAAQWQAKVKRIELDKW